MYGQRPELLGRLGCDIAIVIRLHGTRNRAFFLCAKLPSMAQVFISFIHEEQRYAECVQRFIKAVLGDAVGAFLSSDTWQVYAGERWLDRILEELRTARIVVLMLSPESVKRPWVNFEAGAATIKNVVIIPVCFGGMSKGALPKPYSNYQAVDLMDHDDQHYLVNSIAHHLGSIPCFPEKVARILPPEKEEKYWKPYDDLRACLTP